MMAQMWNASAGMFCDGTCADTPHTGVTTNAFTLFNDLVPTDSIQGAWEQGCNCLKGGLSGKFLSSESQ